MRSIAVRPGTGDDAVSVYERSNRARRQGTWPSRSAYVAQVTGKLHDAADHNTASLFLVGRDDTASVAMALVHPFHADGGSGAVIPAPWFPRLSYVVPERWGTGTGGALLAAVIDEANRRGCRRIFLWTRERRNQRAHRLDRSRGYAPTGRTMTKASRSVQGGTIANSHAGAPREHAWFVKPPENWVVSALAGAR